MSLGAKDPHRLCFLFFLYFLKIHIHFHTNMHMHAGTHACQPHLHMLTRVHTHPDPLLHSLTSAPTLTCVCILPPPFTHPGHFIPHHFLDWMISNTPCKLYMFMGLSKLRTIWGFEPSVLENKVDTEESWRANYSWRLPSGCSLPSAVAGSWVCAFTNHSMQRPGCSCLSVNISIHWCALKYM